MSDQQAVSRASPMNRLSPDDASGKEDQEFAALGGGTRLVSRKSPSVPSSPQGSTSPSEMPPIVQQPIITTPTHIETSNSGHSQTSPVMWQSYSQAQSPQAVYEYHAYGMVPEQWQADSGYTQMDPSAMHLDAIPAQYGMYGHANTMAGNHYPAPSPMDSPVHSRGSDPDASWRSLFAQFNQA